MVINQEPLLCKTGPKFAKFAKFSQFFFKCKVRPLSLKSLLITTNRENLQILKTIFFEVLTVRQQFRSYRDKNEAMVVTRGVRKIFIQIDLLSFVLLTNASLLQ